MLSKLATRLDTWGAGKRLKAFRKGWPANSRDDIEFFDTGKVQYRYRQRGNGPSIVFTADAPATLEFYDELLDVFSKKFRVIVVELPAMGFSVARSSFKFGFVESCDDIALFCESVAGSKAILAFSCGAGLAAIDIAVRRPDLVSKLTLLQTTDWQGFQDWKAKRDPKNILRKPFLGQIAMRKLAKSRAPMWFDLAVGNREKVKPFCDCAATSFKYDAQWPLASAFQRFLRDGSNPLGKVKQPSLVIWGKADRSHLADEPTRAKTIGVNTKVVELDGVGHFPELEDTEKVFEIISEFCAS